MKQPTFWFIFPLLLATSLLQSAGADKPRRKERAYRTHSHDVAAVRTFPTANVEETPSSNLRRSQRILSDSTYGRQSSYYNNESSGTSTSNQASSSSSGNSGSSSSYNNGSSSSSSSNQASSSSSGNSDSSSSTASTYQTYHNCDSSSGVACTSSNNSSNNSQEYEEIDQGLSAWEAGVLSGALTLVVALLFMMCCGCSLYDIFGCAECSRSNIFDLCGRNRKESPLSVSFADEQQIV